MELKNKRISYEVINEETSIGLQLSGSLNIVDDKIVDMNGNFSLIEGDTSVQSGYYNYTENSDNTINKSVNTTPYDFQEDCMALLNDTIYKIKAELIL